MNIRDHSRTEDALRNAALAVSTATGEGVFRELVRSIATILDVEVAFIALPKPDDACWLRMLAFYAEGRMVEDFEYKLAGTPCETVVGHEFRCYPSGIAERFPLDEDFRKLGVESYAGYPLTDARGEPAGLMAVASRRPVIEPELIESVLKIFASRAMVELERERAEAALRASEEQYRAIFNASEDALVLWDAQLRRVDVNPAYERLYGWTREEVIGRGYDTLGIPAQFAEPRLDLVRRTLAGETCHVELESVRKNGERFQADIRTIPFMHRGEPQVLTIARDITERRERDEALRASEEQYRAIFNSSFDSMIIRTLEGEIIDVNPALESMYGYTRDELIGRTFGPIIPENLADAYRAYLAEVAAKRHVRTESRLPRKDGSHVDIEVLGSLVTYHGKPHVLSVARDISERREREQALRASEEQYRAIFNATTDGLVLRDAELRLVDVNPALLAMTGFTRAETIGEERVLFAPPELHGKVRDAYRRALAGEHVVYESQAIRRDGSRFEVEMRYLPIRYQGRPHVLAIARDVTERRRAEQSVRASEEQYRAIFNASEDALVLWDAQLRRVDVNPAYERMFGWSREEVVGRRYEARGVSPEYVERRMELVRRSLAGERCHAELESVRKSGARFQADIRTIPVVHRGEPHVLTIVRDITERREREQALRASEEQYRAIFNASFDGMIIRTLEGEIVDVNPALESMYGFKREELVGKTFGPIISEKRAESFRGYLDEVAAGRHFRTESHVPRKDGSRVYIEVLGSPVRYQGRPHVLSVVRDISERREREQALRASEEQYRAVFDASLDALVLRDEGFRIVDVNPSYQHMSGYAREEVLGADHVVANPPEIDAAVKALHRRALAGEPVRMETRMVRRDGSPIELELSGVRTMYQGRPHVLYAGRDITARKQAEARHRELEAQLRQAQKMEAIGHLTGGIAHDFNNILTGIMGYLTLATEREAASSDAKLARHLQQAQHGATRARELIQQMLTFSRAQKGRPRVVALAPLVEDAVKLLGSSLPSRVELRTALETGLPGVMIDPVHVEQILLNLCINARDAMDGAGTISVGVRLAAPGGGAVCTSCHQAADGRYVELTVADTGPGIAPQVIERMFEPFFSTKEVGRGSGMGLSTVHGIVHEHGGHIVVDTAPGRGSTFRVLLPGLEGEADGAAPEDERQAQRKPLRQRLEGRVLLVDDEQMVGEFMAELLGGWGLEVTVYRNPVEAERWLAEDPARVDLVLTDQTMPKMTGLELAACVGALRPGMPVILYSGYAENLREDDLARCGVRALLAKPVEPEPLFTALAEALRR
jgi:PAS domain S-box-containing protein